MSDNQAADGGISRRNALKRGLMVGGALWVVPAVQVVTMTEAHAETASGPVPARPEGNVAPSEVGQDVLPKTGAGLPPALLAAVGAGLVAAGSATLAAQRRRAAARADNGAAIDAAALVEPPPAAPDLPNLPDQPPDQPPDLPGPRSDPSA